METFELIWDNGKQSMSPENEAIAKEYKKNLERVFKDVTLYKRTWRLENLEEI